ncbi:LacI family transcriptional regulator [Microbacterium protaetiae]|uniref:LacI family transcriptional regulator n=1 Tax=Microbacterium protaetiae TaxID=2509458 RepID=A0A4P6EJ80_9MICO|nr:LacI family DNA-binding transcriptional regulator [Microbacterium protaetiae]QAY61683.1 LacI family transcriptional regulator [Microbacterium protaetiae]
MTASVRDVAEAAGVSVGTVSNVLNAPDKVSEATAQRVHAAIERLGFVRNDAARQLRAGRSRAIGMVVLDLRNPFFTDVARGAEDRAAERGLSVFLANSDERAEREQSALELFEQQRVSGVLVTPIAEDLPVLRRMRDRGTPVVLVDRESQQSHFPSVAVDDVEGGRMAAEHLLAIGRRKLGLVGGPTTLRQVTDRLDGAQQAVAAVADATLEFIGTAALTVDEGRAAGRRIAQRAPAQRPDAIFAANDLVALGLLQGFVMAGAVRVPDDIALIGYDDIDFAAAAVVPLSSVRQPARLIGSTAVDLLSAASDGGAAREQVLFRPELVVRASTVSV